MFGISQNGRLTVALLRRVLRNQAHIIQQNEYIARRQGEIIMANQEIQQEVDDLKAATALIGEGVGTLQTNLLTALNKIAELEQQGVNPETIAALRSAVDGAQTIAQQFAKAADSDQPTPDVSELPQPVEDVAGNDVPAGGETATGDDEATPAPETGNDETPA